MLSFAVRQKTFTNNSEEIMDAIIPAAGLATRMRGVPKFLLPADADYTTLLEHHLVALEGICETIWIPTRPELVLLLDTLGISRERVVIVPVTTGTMNQTILRVLEISSADKFILTMPDTRYVGQQPYKSLAEIDDAAVARVACWKIRESQRGKLGQLLIDHKQNAERIIDKDVTCTYEHAWGALSFKRELKTHIHPAEPHVGYALKAAIASGERVSADVMEGSYYDCGTPKEYIEMLRYSAET